MLAKQLIPFIDLTSLNDTDEWSNMVSLLDNAMAAQNNNDAYRVAALCIWPKFVAQMLSLMEERQLQPALNIATVINFPAGEQAPDRVFKATEDAVSAGACEIDVVIPYRALLRGQTRPLVQCVEAARAGSSEHAVLKVIIESGALVSEKHIKTASELSIEHGANFIKTSTGKFPINATLEAAQFMLETIKTSGQTVGFKASGGIANYQQAIKYVELTKSILGETWLQPQRFRFGASGLLSALLGNDPIERSQY